MSLIASLLTSAAGGGLLGVLGQGVNNCQEIWRANAESKIAEATALALSTRAPISLFSAALLSKNLKL